MFVVSALDASLIPFPVPVSTDILVLLLAVAAGCSSRGRQRTGFIINTFFGTVVLVTRLAMLGKVYF
ncbi:MAG TPA: hypothetical protein VFA02_04840 [Pseudacidobacterium sp.]|nr:hypothetical protein [Pseudacidobacterium sp.]